MSHNFFFETYKFIDDRLEHISQELVKTAGDNINRQYVAGRIDGLCEIESFLERKIKPKLPKRLRLNFSSKNRVCSVDAPLPSDSPINDL